MSYLVVQLISQTIVLPSAKSIFELMIACGGTEVDHMGSVWKWNFYCIF